MTDKEWNELWKYVEKRNVLVKVLDYFGNCYKNVFEVGDMRFCKNGNILCGYCLEVLIENRTPAQMKAIIDNLL